MSDAAAVELEVVHETRYGYAAPVTQAQHLAYLQPLQDARQQLLSHELTIDPPPPQRLRDVDGYGNARTLFSLSLPHRELRVRAVSRVALRPAPDPLAAEASPRCEDVRRRLRYEAGARYAAAVEFASLRPTCRAACAYGVPALPPACRWPGALALMHRIHADFEFRGDSTEVDTPLSSLPEQRSACTRLRPPDDRRAAHAQAGHALRQRTC